MLADLDFADDIALLSDTLNQAQDLLCRVENAADIVGLHMNASKTKVIAYNSVDDNILVRGLMNQKMTSQSVKPLHGRHAIRCDPRGSLICPTP